MGNLHEAISTWCALRTSMPNVWSSAYCESPAVCVNEDFGKYPRTLQAGLRQACSLRCGAGVCADRGGSVPQPQQVMVEPPPIAQELCGAFRPGHFRGVATWY